MQLKTSLSIIFSSIIVSLALIVAAKISDSFWTAMGALGTCAAVVWAIFHQGILEWWRKPNLEISLYEKDAPHLRPVSVGTPDKPAMYYMLSLELLNNGKSIARGAQPLVTDVRSSKMENGFPITAGYQFLYYGFSTSILKRLQESQLRKKIWFLTDRICLI